jgi:hypothetical protein
MVTIQLEKMVTSQKGELKTYIIITKDLLGKLTIFC